MPRAFEAILSWRSFLIALLVFGFAPGAVLRLILLAFRRDDPRRRELLAELYAVPRIERPFWVFEQLEVALFEGIWERVRAATRVFTIAMLFFAAAFYEVLRSDLVVAIRGRASNAAPTRRPRQRPKRKKKKKKKARKRR